MTQKTLLFDMGNVLLRFNPKELLAHYTDDQTQQERIHQALFTSLWFELDLGIRETNDILTDVYQDLSSDDRVVVESLMRDWFMHMSVIQPMEELIEELKARGFKLILCSNASMQFYAYQHHFNVLQNFDAHVISAKIQKVKPHKEFFDHVLTTYHLTASDCIFVDDLIQNIEGAQQVGLITYHFKNDANQLKAFILNQ